MLENVIFFINNAMSARCSVTIHKSSAFAILLAETSLYFSAIFVGGDEFCSPVQGTLATLQILTLWFMKGV